MSVQDPSPAPTVERALLFLAEQSGTGDPAAGFNSYDTHLGHQLAEKVFDGVALTGKQRRAAYRMMRKYADQLAAAGLRYDRIEEPPDDVATPASGPSSQRVSFTTENGRIVARTPFRYKDLCKSVPGARWVNTLRAWTYPESATSALTLRDTFRGVATEVDARFSELVAEGEVLRAAGRHRDAADEDLPHIPHLRTEAWRHPRAAFHFALPQPAAMLAMDVGTGKSLVAVALVAANGAERVLICSPVSVIAVWTREFRLHSAVATHVVALREGSVEMRTRQADEALHECRCGRPHVIVINYEAAYRQPFSSWSYEQSWDYVIADESHRIQSYSGVQSKYMHKVGRHSRRRLALTGTPMSQSPLTLFGQYRFLDQDIFGLSWTSFTHRYAVMGGYGNHEVVGYQNLEQLNERFYSIAYRVSNEVLDLPPENDVTRSCALSPVAMRVYRSVRDELYAELAQGGEVSAPNVLVKLLRLQQITGGSVTDDEGHAQEVDHSKAMLLQEFLEDLPPHEPVVVFCRFVHDLDVVKRVAEGIGRRYAELSGRRNDLDADAHMPEGVDVMAVQEQSGGVGIDLTRAHYGVFYSLGFSLANHVQCRGRVVRPGQSHPVLWTHLVAEGTVDEQVYEALRARQDVVQYVLEGITRERATDQPQRAPAAR